MSRQVYAGILRVLDKFEKTSRADILMKYMYPKEQADALVNAYRIDEIAGDNSDFERVVRLLKWLHNVYHNGSYQNNVKKNALDLLNYGFKGDESRSLNCADMSIILTECSLALGLKARTITLMPFSPYDFDNHVVSNVYIRELNKWVILDPTYGLYFKDEFDKPLSLFEIRSKLANLEEIFFNEEVNHNGDEVNYEQLIEYYSKDFFYFECSEINSYGSSSGVIRNRWLTLAPEGIDIKKIRIENVKYRLGSTQNQSKIQQRINEIQNDGIIYMSSEDFEKRPE